MKKIFTMTLVVIITAAVFSGCGKSVTENHENQKNNEPVKETVSSASGSDSNGGTPFGKFVADTPDLDIQIYDNVSGATIDFNIESFKLDNIDNFSDLDMARIDNFTASELQTIATTKADLLNKLTVAFKNAGIKVAINETSGEVSLDSSVLFGGDSAVLSTEGKTFLNEFVNTYSSVVLSEEFDGFISKILIEGHTAPVSGSTYESGLPLSEERANNVKSYCLSSETGISSNSISELTSILEAVGVSNSRPVKDASGNIDMAASRRVSFRFLINLE